MINKKNGFIKIEDSDMIEFCESFGFKFISKVKDKKDYSLTMICPSGNQVVKTKGNLKRDKKCKCGDCRQKQKKVA